MYNNRPNSWFEFRGRKHLINKKITIPTFVGKQPHTNFKQILKSKRQ